MEKNRVDQERWALLNSAENAHHHAEQDDDDDEEEEALSLSDLPLVHHSRREQKHEEYEQNYNAHLKSEITHHEDFDFCSFSKESEMCAADEVFFQGQILPLRHSISSEKGLLQYSNSTRSVSRSESMDHCYSGGFISSRSSSIGSHQSSSSSGSSAAKIAPKYKPNLPPRNQFHSHPSPSPRIRFPSNRQSTINPNHRNRKSTVWNIFKLGLVATPPEIALQDIKTRCPGNINGSRNSTSSNSSSMCSSGSFNKKTKQSMAAILLGGGCKCSADAVDAVSSRAVIVKKSSSESDVDALDRIEKGAVKSAKMTKKQTAKKHLSHHRTFEWLKQLSIEGAPDEAKILN